MSLRGLALSAGGGHRRKVGRPGGDGYAHRPSRGPRTVDGRVSNALVGNDLDVAITTSTIWPGTHPANADVYEPHQFQRVPKAGAWAMVTRQLPPLERRLDEDVRPGRVFWVEHHDTADDDGFMPNGTYKVLCRSPFGELTLWPYEYRVMRPEFLTDAWQRGEYVFHPMAVSEKQFSDVLFYCLSRGISRADATVMALGTMTGAVGWFELRQNLAPEIEAFIVGFADVGVLTEKNHARRRKAQERRNAR